MIRDEVLFYAIIGLLVLLAFYLIPMYERMTDGIEVDPRTKAATSPTNALTPQIAYPSKSNFGSSHISPFLGQKASEQPARPTFPSFEQFTTEEEERKKKEASKPNPNNVVPHTNIPAKPVEPPKPNHNNPSNKPNHNNPSTPSHGGGGAGGGGGTGTGTGTNDDSSDPQPYTSRGDIYNLPTVTSANTPPLTSQAPTTQAPTNGFQQTTLPAPTYSSNGSGAPYDPLNQYVLKSSLVPYTCPTGACGTPSQLPSSKHPGDMDMPDYARMKPNQKNIGRPTGEAFSQKGDEPQPFLTDFAPFTK